MKEASLLLKEKYGIERPAVPFYILYGASCAEGMVVVRSDDTQFPMGYDIQIGVRYSDSLGDFARIHDVFLHMHEAVVHDSALYDRYGIDHEEVTAYETLRREKPVDWSFLDG